MGIHLSLVSMKRDLFLQEEKKFFKLGSIVFITWAVTIQRSGHMAIAASLISLSVSQHLCISPLHPSAVFFFFLNLNNLLEAQFLIRSKFSSESHWVSFMIKTQGANLKMKRNAFVRHTMPYKGCVAVSARVLACTLLCPFFLPSSFSPW